MNWAKKDLPPEEHKWPSDGSHVMSHWMVFDKLHHYRTCVHPECGHHEVVLTSEIKE